MTAAPDDPGGSDRARSRRGRTAGRPTWLLVLGGVVLAAAAVVAVLVLADDDEPVDGEVLIVGDSLTVGALGPDLGRPGWVFEAAVGRTTAEGIDLVEGKDLTKVRTVIVALGTNDSDATEGAYGELVDDMVEAIGPGPRILWVNVDVNTPQLAGATDVNAAIAAGAARHDQLQVADWNAYVRTVPGFDGMRDPDGIHYLDEGSLVRARWTTALA